MSTIYLPRISNTPGDRLEFTVGNIYVLQVYNLGDFDGNSLSHCSFFSSISGTPSTLDLSLVGDIIVQYCDFKDITIINGTLTNVGGINNGGNTGIVFIPVFQPVYWDSRNADVTKPDFKQAKPSTGLIIDVFINPRNNERVRQQQQYQY
jgi:hypothetical protein